MQWRQSGLKSGGCGSGFGNLGSWVLKVHQMEARSIILRVSLEEFLFNYTQIIIFLKSHHFGKCSQIVFLYNIGYNNISWRPHPKIWEVASPQD